MLDGGDDMAHVLIQLSLSPMFFLALLAYDDYTSVDVLADWVLTMLACLLLALLPLFYNYIYCFACILWSMFCIALLIYILCSTTILFWLYSMILDHWSMFYIALPPLLRFVNLCSTLLCLPSTANVLHRSACLRSNWHLWPLSLLALSTTYPDHRGSHLLKHNAPPLKTHLNTSLKTHHCAL